MAISDYKSLPRKQGRPRRSQLAIDARLKELGIGSLRDYLIHMDLLHMSYQEMADMLKASTGISVSFSTCRNWLREILNSK